MKVLITGGAGYIGSHIVKALGKKGHDVVVYDNLSSGHEWALLYGRLIKGDLGDRELLEAVFEGEKFDAVIHMAAFIVALEYLAAGGMSRIYNCGYGHGHSVREVVDRVKSVTGIDFPVRNVKRRAGDPPSLVADPSRIKKGLGWTPRHDDLEYIIKTAWEWEKKMDV